MRYFRNFLAVLVCLWTASSGFGALWSVTGSETLWTGENNWGTGISNPGSTVDAFVYTQFESPAGSGTWFSSAPILIDSTQAATCKQLYLGYTGGGNMPQLTMTGGTLAASGFLEIGRNGNNTRFDLQGGTVSGTYLKIASINGKHAYFTMSGGSLNTTVTNSANYLSYIGSSHFDMSGGTMTMTRAYLTHVSSGITGTLDAVFRGTASFTSSYFTNVSGGTADILIKDNAVVTVTTASQFALGNGDVLLTLADNGKLRISGDQIDNATINGWIGTKIVGAGGVAIEKEYIGGYTVYSVPEPATLLLISLGIGALRIRR